MTTLTDRTALELNRKRALKMPVDYLQVAAADEVQERLEEVNRSFTAPAVVTGWPSIWSDRIAGPIVTDGETLPLEPTQHDLVIHAMSLHWANDIVGQLVQCRRALKPDGLFIGTFLGGQTLHELRSALAEAEVAIQGGLSPRVAPMGEVRDLGGLLQRAGFALPVADVTTLTVSYKSPLHLMQELRSMGESNALTGRQKTFTRRQVLLKAAEVYEQSYGTDDGRIPATFDIITLTGWAPSSDQPQPLRPGSASERLASALGATEVPLKRSND
jgi:SAM-dependent methyltransferase